MTVLEKNEEQDSGSAPPTLGAVVELRPFTRDEFYTMERAGIFDNDARVELIDGRIIRSMAPIGGAHGWGVTKLTRQLIHATDDTELELSVQSGISLSENRELQPDFAVYRPKPENAQHNPTADQVLLVVEVSDATLAYDRTDKMRLYAEGGVPEYWVVDIAHKRVYVHTEPEDGLYARIQQVGVDGSLTIAGKTIAVTSIF